MKRFLAIFGTMAIAALMMGGVANAGEKECTTETTGWVLESPGPKWVQVDEKTVTDKEAVADSYTDWVDSGDPVKTEENEAPAEDTDTERWVFVKEVAGEGTVTELRHYSLKGNSGIGKNDVPVFPADYWQANAKKEPHYQGKATPAQKPDGTPYVDGEAGLHYVSHGSAGKRDWFYLEIVEVPNVDYLWQKQVRDIIPGSDAVTHQEFKFEKTTCVTVEEPNNPPKNNPEKPTEPSEPTLPHTGANLWLALIGTLAVGGGAALTWASRQKLTGI
jgi:LPXTG-motif cell wall-anchored protein